MEADKIIDVVGKSCPFPLISLAKEVNNLHKGQIISIMGNDPLFESETLDFCKEGGHEVVEVEREGRKVTITFRIGEALPDE